MKMMQTRWLHRQSEKIERRPGNDPPAFVRFVLFGYKCTINPLPFCEIFHLDICTHWVYNKGTNKERNTTTNGGSQND